MFRILLSLSLVGPIRPAHAAVAYADLSHALDVLRSHVAHVYPPDQSDELIRAGAFISAAGITAWFGGEIVQAFRDEFHPRYVHLGDRDWASIATSVGQGTALWGTLVTLGAATGALIKRHRDPARAERRALARFLRWRRDKQLARLEKDPALAERLIALAGLIETEDQVLADRTGRADARLPMIYE